MYQRKFHTVLEQMSEKISHCIRAKKIYIRETFSLYQIKCYNLSEKPSHCIGLNFIMYQSKLKEIVGCIRVKQIS